MVENYNKKHFLSLLEFFKFNFNNDFYITSNNIRNFIKDDKSLKLLLKESKDVRIVEEKGDILGLILLWKSFGNNITRFYVKLSAINKKIADQLLTVLLWNVKDEIYTKIKKDSSLLTIFKNKGFVFSGFRGTEILLKYIKRDPTKWMKSEQK